MRSPIITLPDAALPWNRAWSYGGYLQSTVASLRGCHKSPGPSCLLTALRQQSLQRQKLVTTACNSLTQDSTLEQLSRPHVAHSPRSPSPLQQGYEASSAGQALEPQPAGFPYRLSELHATQQLRRKGCRVTGVATVIHCPAQQVS